ncbi:TonB-dependent siderophore receptor [Pedomonas mirosovicensis]|uniref:TonB-dependent siderophore receptor n=1 Tax=Pedomonas mirosovicensis TaxID=2908641 RepID=UPI002168AE32|nr:TonB-dependent siderophore receptor [Pedomonas mirosovicensis]MCH8686563.1 TonB-dependent siderophore receptor [Pedomonas mirosovicensis]
MGRSVFIESNPGLARLSLRAAILGAAALAGTPAIAAEARNAAMPDLVVTAPNYVPSGSLTATKTTAPLIETPQSVSVVTRDQIDLLNFIDVQQAVRYTAGIVGENYGPDLRFDFLTLRGFIPVQYIDGLQAPVSATIANVGVDLYGFESVDVLKGPASVLYGTTPPGGIYNLTSRRPSAEFGGEVAVKYGTDDYKQAAGTITGALTDGVTARLTGLYRDRDSQTDFVTAERAYAAPAVSIALGPDTTLTGLGYYQYDRTEGDPNGFLPVLGVLEDNPLGRISRGTNLGEPDLNFYRREQFAAGYELVHRFSDALSFTQNARWTEYHEDMRTIYATGLAADNRTVSRADYPFKDDVNQFAIDSRLDGRFSTGPIEHRLLAGLDYRNYREASAFGFAATTPIDLFDPVYGTAPVEAPALSPWTDQRLKQTGLYVQDQAKLGGFILTLSGRQDWSRRTDYLSPDAPTDKDDKFTYRVGGTYLFDTGIAPYVSYATSFQPVVGADASGQAFDPSEGKQWEAGVKYDGRTLSPGVKLFATAAVYKITQTNVVTTDPNNANFSVQTGEVEVKGFELEAVARIHDQLSINGSYTYADTEVTESNGPDLGARLVGQPKHKLSLFVDYTLQQGPLAGFGVGVGGRYLSNSPGSLPSAFAPTVYYTPSTTLFDAIIHYDTADWRFALNGSNIFDKRYAGRCTGPVGCFFGQSRQVIATVTRKF